MTDQSRTHRWMAAVRGLRLPRRRGPKLLVSLLVIVAVVGTTVSVIWWRSETLPENAAFRVGDQVVTKEDFDRRVDTLRALYGVQPPTEAKQADQFRRDSAKATAVSMILDKEAEQQGAIVADKSARDVLTRLIESQMPGAGPEGRKQFVQALGNVGTSEPAVVNEIKRQMAVSQLFDRVTAGTSVDDQELKTAFDQRREQLGPPERRHIRNIVVSQRPEAEDVATQARQGTAFPALAEQRTQDASTKSKGGDLGIVAAQQLEPAYAQAAFGVPSGTVFGPVQTQFGWNIGQVEEVTPKQPASFDAVKSDLRKQLESEKALGRWRSWLRDRIANAEVDYAGAYRPADPLSPPEAGGPAPKAEQGQPGSPPQ